MVHSRRIHFPSCLITFYGLVICIIGFATHSWATLTTSIGPGVAGQVHAVAFDPADPNTIYAGGDNCGVYVSRNFGVSWTLWNDGLQNSDLTRTYYIDDLLVLGPESSAAPSRYGVYAATHGGVYSRESDSMQWVLETDKEVDCRYAYEGDLVGNRGEPVPFSCFAYDELNQTLYAGTGHGRVQWTSGDRYYPEISSDKISTCEPSNAQYSLWALDCSTGGELSNWYPVIETAGHGRATQIAVSNHDGIAEVVFACRDGIFSIGDPTKTSGATDLWASYDKAFNQIGWSERHWGVGAGTGGILYALAIGTTVDEGGVPVYKYPGVYSVDLTIPSSEWEFVGDLQQVVPPRNETWNDIVTYTAYNGVKAQFLTLTVSLGTGRIDPQSPNPIDEVFVGERIATLNGGHYRFGEFESGAGTAVGWSQTLYLEGTWNGFSYSSFDWRTGASSPVGPGWCSNYSIASTAPMVIGNPSRDRMLAVDYHMPVVTEDGGATWHQVYSSSDGDIGSSRGLNIMGAQSAAIGSNGKLYIGSLDFGVFETPSALANDFRWLNWYGTGSPNAYDLEIVQNQGQDQVYVLRNAPKVANSSWALGTGAAQAIGLHVDSEYQTADEWHYISSTIGDIYAGFEPNSAGVGKYKLQDMAFQGPDTVFTSCHFEESAMVLDEGELVAKVTGSVGKVFRGVQDDTGQWSWEELGLFPNDPVTGPIGRRQSFESLAVLQKQRTVILGAYEGQGGLGGLYAFPSDISTSSSSGLVVWLNGNSTTGIFVDAASRNIRSIAVDENEEVIYVGSRGLYWYDSGADGWGSVLRAEIPSRGEAPVGWTALANESDQPFNYGTPAFLYDGFEGAGPLEINRRLTHIQDIAVDPNNPYRIYVGIGPSATLNPKNGVWRYDPDGSWTQILGGDGDGVPTVPVTVVTVNQYEPSRLYAGTGGQEFFEVAITPSPIPMVNAHAEYTISQQGGDHAVLAVHGTDTFGGPLEAVYVDASAMGGSKKFELNDENLSGDLIAGDNIWSATLTDPIPTAGDISISIIARDPNQNTYSGELTVQVVADAIKANYTDASTAADELEQIGGLPYSASLINSGVNLFDTSLDADLGDEDLLVSIKQQSFTLFNSRSQVDGFIRMSLLTEFDQSVLPAANTYGIAVADYDNDGYEDILATNYQLPQLYRYDPAAQRYIHTTYTDLNGGDISRMYSAAWADYNQDGWVDLIIGGCILDNAIPPSSPGDPDGGGGSGGGEDPYINPGGGIYAMVFKNERGKLVAQTDVFPAESLLSVAFGFSWEDLNGDGYIDLFVGNYFEPGCKVFINGGPATGYTFTEQTAAWFPNSGNPNLVVGVELIDLNNNGRPDLILSLMDSADNMLVYFNDGSNFVLADKQATNLPVIKDDLTDVMTGDFDLNGFIDLIPVPNEATKSPRIILNSIGSTPGVFSQTVGLDVPSGALHGAVANDWDNDGDLDLFFGRESDSGTSKSSDFYYVNNDFTASTPSSKVIKIRLVGGDLNSGRTNADAIGAKVEIIDGANIYTRRVSGGNGRGRQNSRTLLFGLPENNGGDVTVRVTWPDGGVQETDLAPSASTHVVRDSRSVAILTGSETAYRSLTPGNLRLIFEWTATVPFDDVEVNFQPNPGGINSAACQCGGSNEVINLNTDHPEVDIQVVREGPAAYRHYLIFNNWCCNVGCVYRYTMGGRFGGVSVVSSEMEFTITVCGKGIGPLPDIEN